MLKNSIKKQSKELTFSAALRSFMGYLEGTGKSLLTMKDYRLDLESFRRFLQKECPEKELAVSTLSAMDVKAYEKSLQALHLKSNTRRRKILTLTLFLSYLAQRKKVMQGFLNKVPVPHKIERIPLTVSTSALLQRIQTMEFSGLLGMRNRCLMWILTETGCLVSEVTQLKFEQFERRNNTVTLHLGGKLSRSVPVSIELGQAVKLFCAQLQAHENLKNNSWIFLGFNRFGPLKKPMSARGVELLVKELGPTLGFPKIMPRTLRHSVILAWFEEGLTEQVVQNRLGLKTNYAFKKLPQKALNPTSKPHVVSE